MKSKNLLMKLFSVVLCTLLLVGICPNFSLDSFAATEITAITIMDVNIPRPDATPDYTATYSTGCLSTKEFDTATQKNGIIWYYKRVNNYVDLGTTDTFKENVSYTVAIVVKAANGYQFKTNGSSPAVSCTVNGNKANAVAMTGQRPGETLVVVFTFPASEYFTVNTVGAKSIDIPLLDNTPDFTAESISDRYTVSSLSWFDITASKYLSASDTFQANHRYRLQVSFRVIPGNKFKADINDVADFTAKINGETADVISSTTSGGTKASITTEYDVLPTISKISVSDIEIPKVGKRADYTCKIDGTGYELDTYGIDWTKNGGYGSELPIAEEFAAGQSYELKVWLIAKEGFTFKTNNIGDVIADVKINGLNGEVYISDSKRCQIIYVFTVPEDITTVGVTDITEPFAGGTADMTGTVTGTGYEIANIEWHDSTNGHGNYISNITSFTEGREYTLDIFIATTDNYSFRLDPDYDIPDISAKINGKSARVYSEGNRDEAIISYKYKTPIEVVTVTGIDAPVAGKTPDTEATSTKAGYKVAKVEWYDTTSTPHTKLSATDKFLAGHKYTVNVTLYAINDFVFFVDGGYQEITGTINGKDAIEYGSHEYGTATIGYEFTVPAAHTHTPSTWKSDKDGHWKECTDSTCKAVTTKKTAHQDKNGDEKCDSCSFPMPIPVNPDLLLKTGCTYTVSHTDKTVIIPIDTKISTVKASIANEKFAILTKDNKAAENDASIATGMKIQVLNKDNSVLSEYSVIVIYDVDGNGLVQAADARLALRASVSLEKLEGAYYVAADADASGEVKAADARTILRKSVGLD